MKNTTKLFGIIAFVAVIGFSVAACSKANPDTDFSYEPSEDSKGMIITRYTGESVNVVIPAKIQKLPVVKVRGFHGTKIISVVIPASVKEIEAQAFSGCSNLTSVTFKGKDIVIGQEAFEDCENLDNLVFTDGALKPFKYDGELGPQEWFGGRTVFNTEHYFYNPPRRSGGEYVFHFNSGTSAFYGCDKLPTETISKLKAMGFLSPEEMYELEEKADRGDLQH